MPRTITITTDSGVFRASVQGTPNVTATGDTEGAALIALANRISEHGWDWAKPEPVKTETAQPKVETKTDVHPAKP